jgi:hypothetical protein
MWLYLGKIKAFLYKKAFLRQNFHHNARMNAFNQHLGVPIGQTEAAV